ncbi:MAG TPA: DUF1887 family CARF protein [bacterium]|nr:DUF1887 family CARF protein [bacterium]HQB11029.1 DUF1887 family CARF protein [bacterium]HQM85024.1 DUF1887 family CARF protein [bacterium]HRQ69253.1 DUF1887 family CARF protein [bacterium]
MGRKVLISIVSDQTIPNVLFIKDFKEMDEYVFLSTEKMEQQNQTEKIIKSSGLDKTKCHIEKIHESDIDEIKKVLTNIPLSQDAEFIVNITGGTKIMSLAVYDFFSKFKNSVIFYMPIGENGYQKIFPETENLKAINFKVSLQNYLSAYGVEIKKQSATTKDLNFLNTFKTELFNNYRNEIAFLIKLQNDRPIKKVLEKKGEIDWNDIRVHEFVHKNSGIYLLDNIDKLFKSCGFNDGVMIKSKSLRFITGGWFEELAYSLVKENLKISDEQIALGTEVIKDNDNRKKNEFDVAFISNNSLYIIECKTSMESEVKGLFAETVYKQAAIRKDLGLSAQSYLFTLDKVDNIDHIKRAETLGIKIIDLTVLNDSGKLEETFFKKFK